VIAIEAEGLRKSFAGKRRAAPVLALRWVDLSVPRGGVCALLLAIFVPLCTRRFART
jgi:hypothetical protein